MPELRRRAADHFGGGKRRVCGHRMPHVARELGDGKQVGVGQRGVDGLVSRHGSEHGEGRLELRGYQILHEAIIAHSKVCSKGLRAHLWRSQ